MKEDTKTLDEVVVVGYSTQKKESLTGALQTVKSDKLKDITTPSVENMLNGKVPGVYVAPGSGQPGSGGAVVCRCVGVFHCFSQVFLYLGVSLFSRILWRKIGRVHFFYVVFGNVTAHGSDDREVTP